MGNEVVVVVDEVEEHYWYVTENRPKRRLVLPNWLGLNGGVEFDSV